MRKIKRRESNKPTVILTESEQKITSVLHSTGLKRMPPVVIKNLIQRKLGILTSLGLVDIGKSIKEKKDVLPDWIDEAYLKFLFGDNNFNEEEFFLRILEISCLLKEDNLSSSVLADRQLQFIEGQTITSSNLDAFSILHNLRTRVNESLDNLNFNG